MGKVKMLIMAVLALGMTLGFAGMASAAAINCGDCHGTSGAPLPNSGDNCGGTARGLHGTHYNYSSASFKKTVANYGKCAYCHITPADSQPTRTHNNNFINVTGSLVNGIGSTTLTENQATHTCTNACHNNRAQTATWGNYTSPLVVLSCRSCHDNYQDKFNGVAAGGIHNQHLLSNCTTPNGYGLMSASSDLSCQNCHPNNTNDTATFFVIGSKTDNGTKKVYTHAADGTNVVADNATLQNNIVSATKNNLSTTCSNNCHANNATYTWGQAISSGTLCDTCHYCTANGTGATSDTNNNAATSAAHLNYAHSEHFSTGGGNIACSVCHLNHALDADPGSHARKLPLSTSIDTSKNKVTVGNGSITFTYDPVAHTCTNTGGTCHGSGTTPDFTKPYTTAQCAICHFYPGVAGRDWASTNGHSIRYDAPVVNTHMTASGFNANTDVFATVVADSTKCGKCHHIKATSHRNGTGFAHLSTVSGNGQCGTNFTFTPAGIGNNSNVTCGDVKCHSGKPATPNWD